MHITHHDPAREAAKVVFQDLATADPKPGWEERLDAALDAYDTVLAATGRLLAPELAATPAELDSIARWLAEQSDFNRYWSGRGDDGEPVHEGWRELRAHPRHVEIAFAKARKRLISGDTEQLTHLLAARRALLNAAGNPE